MRCASLKWLVGVELLFFSITLSGQQSFPELVEAAFGLNQDLVNGIQHANRYQRILGDPFFLSDGFERGSIVIDQRFYPDVNLRYDLFSQQVSIEYDGMGGGVFSLITVSERLREFSIGGFEFERVILPEQAEQYYQVVSTTFFTTYVHWEKILLPNNNSVYYSDHFSNPRLSYFLEIDEAVFPFYNRKSFGNLFPEEVGREVRKILRKGHVKFKNADPETIVATMIRVEELLLSSENQ